MRGKANQSKCAIGIRVNRLTLATMTDISIVVKPETKSHCPVSFDTAWRLFSICSVIISRLRSAVSSMFSSIVSCVKWLLLKCFDVFHNVRCCKGKLVYVINQTFYKKSFDLLHYLTFREKKTMDYALITMNFFVSLQTQNYINIIRYGKV